MTNTQHTPGPWIVGARYSGNKVEIADASYDKVICTVWTHQFQGSTFEPDKQFQPLPYGAANARLIAAAPGMLASLERLVTLMNIVGDEPFRNGVTDSTGSMDEGIVIASKWLHEARAAIAKATGQ